MCLGLCVRVCSGGGGGDKPPKAMGNLCTPGVTWRTLIHHIAEQGTPYLDNIVYEEGVLVWERWVTEWNTHTVYHSIPQYTTQLNKHFVP